MKKSTLILWIVAAVIAVSSVPLFAQGNIGAGVCGLVIAAILFVVGFRKKKAAPAPKQESAPAAPAPAAATSAATSSTTPKSVASTNVAAVSAPSSTPRPVTLQDVKGYCLKYSYSDVDVAGSENYDLSGLELGYMIDFVPEPDNAHDPNAIAILFCGVKRGYLYANKLQNMYHDFRARGGDAIGKVSSTNSGRLQLLIGFYEKVESEYEKLVKNGVKFVSFKLTGNANAEMQDNLRLCTIGDEVKPSYDPEKDKWIAECSYGELGFFPSSAEETLEHNKRAFVSHVQENEASGKYSVTVSVLIEQ